MRLTNERNLSGKKIVVLEKYSERPRKSEELSRELKQKMSRPTFYRILQSLLESSSIYRIPESEKKSFGIGKKGKYYFRRDEEKAEAWKKIMGKVRGYSGGISPWNLMNIIQRRFSGYPLISVGDIEEIINVLYITPADFLLIVRGELFKFLEPQIERLGGLPDRAGLGSIQDALQTLFEKCVQEALDPSTTNSPGHAEKAFGIICRLNSRQEALRAVEFIVTGEVDSSTTWILPQLLQNMVTIYSKSYGSEEIVAFLREEVRKFNNAEIELSLEDQEQFKVVQSKRDALQVSLDKLLQKTE